MANKKIPNGLVDAEVYINGSNTLAGIAEVELPKIEYKTVTNEQMGLTSETDVPLIGHFSKLEAKIKMDTVDHTMLNFNNLEPILVECLGAHQSINRETHGVELGSIDATFKGMIKGSEGLKLKPGDKIETSFDLAVTYYKLVIGGVTIIEIDVLNNVTNFNGSTNETIRTILGLI